MQVLDVSIVDNKPTVEIVVDDAEFYVGTFQNWSIGGGVVIWLFRWRAPPASTMSCSLWVFCFRFGIQFLSIFNLYNSSSEQVQGFSLDSTTTKEIICLLSCSPQKSPRGWWELTLSWSICPSTTLSWLTVRSRRWKSSCLPKTWQGSSPSQLMKEALVCSTWWSTGYDRSKEFYQVRIGFSYSIHQIQMSLLFRYHKTEYSEYEVLVVIKKFGAPSL